MRKTLIYFVFTLTLSFLYLNNLIAQVNPIVSFQKISNTQGNFGSNLSANDLFGNSSDSIGDINGDGVTDIVVSSYGDDEKGTDMGAIYILRLTVDGFVKSFTKITKNKNGFTGNIESGDIFGSGFAALGDINNDGHYDIAVGAEYDDDGGNWNGAIYLLALDTSGMVLSTQKISATSGGFTGILSGTPAFGSDIANIGDLNGDGINDLAVGSRRDNDGGTRHGAVWILFMNANGTVHHHKKISDTQGGFTGTLDTEDFFGVCVEYLGDINNDGHVELAVGSHYDDDGGSNKGAIYILSLDTGGTVLSYQKISDTYGNFSNVLSNEDKFGVSITKIGDLNNDSVIDIAVGAYGDNTAGSHAGAFYILYLNANGSVKAHVKVTEAYNNFTGNLDPGDLFGVSVSSIGKYGDMYALLIGARADDDGATNAGAAYVLSIEGDIYSSLNSLVLHDDFVYNNPVQNQLFIRHSQDNIDLELYDINGKLIIKTILVNGSCSIDLSGLSSGMYIGVLEKGNYRKSFKIIKE